MSLSEHRCYEGDFVRARLPDPTANGRVVDTELNGGASVARGDYKT